MLQKILLICSVLLFTSSSSAQDTYTIEITNGVRHIHSIAPKWGKEQRIRLEFVQKIGVLESDDENYMFYGPFDLEEDNERNIYIVDSGNLCIKKFDFDGKFISKIGHKGGGPGEFVRNPLLLNIDPQNNLYIYDGFQFQVIDQNNHEIKRFRSPIKANEFLLFDNSLVLLSRTTRGIRIKNDQLINKINIQQFNLSQVDLNGNLLKNFGNELLIDDDKTLYYIKNNAFVDCNDNGDIALTYKYYNQIEKYASSGRLVWISNRILNFTPHYSFDKNHINKLEGDDYDILIPEFTHISNQINFDRKQRIWIETFTRFRTTDRNSDDYLDSVVFEIYADDGFLLGTVPVPVYFSKFHIFNDRIYLIDTNDQMCVYVYKIIEND